MSLGAPILQKYPSGVYQPGNPSPDPNIRLIQPYLDISDSTFASSELLALEVLLPNSGTYMNITILDDPISSSSYISQLSSTAPISYQFPVDICRNIYVLSIDNEDPALTTTDVQILCEKQTS